MASDIGKGKRTYALNILDMLAKHHHFLFCEETLEVLPRVRGVRYGVRVSADPFHAVSGGGEQGKHQACLRRQLDIDDTITETSNSAVLRALLESLDELNSRVEARKLAVRILSLAGDSVHDDMDGLMAVVEDLRRPTQEGDDLAARRLIRDLGFMRYTC